MALPSRTRTFKAAQGATWEGRWEVGAALVKADGAASEEAILSIPGVGARMLHEFEEYRPYRAMAQFRREIGKYVDDDELDRLARYVEIR